MQLSSLLKWAERWRWVLFLVIVFAALKIPLSDHLHRAKRQFNVVENCKWSACFTWMESAKVFRETGVWLALKDQGGSVIPYECGSCADDIGHALFLSIISKAFSTDLRLVDFVRFNAYINLLGMVILLIFFYQMRRMILFSCLLFMTAYYFLFFNGFYSPHYAGLGLAGFVFLLPLSLLAYHQKWCSKRSALIYIGLGLVLFGIATLMRSVYGYLGLATTLFIMGGILWERKGNFIGLLPWIAMLLLTVGAWMSPKWTLDLRDHLFHFNQEENDFTKPVWEGPHGISHNLFIGLGIVPNKFGITYEDLDGYEFVKRIDPHVSYTSTKHYEILSDLYFQYLKEDPLEILRIYYEKTKIILKFPPFLLSTLLLPLSLFIFIFYDRRMLLFYLLSAAGTSFFMLQGILAHVDKSYIFPGTLFSFLHLGFILEFFLARLREKQLKVISL